ncbi:Mannosyl-glycoprotein endo-beta-N-acetylglucosamidase-like domain-containing protein [Hyphomicrobium sp. 1Nfss2.1]|uniref:hypothetical protein n=1 Tax=Hyphomicrobium sp. 1Nfss2.1 TaxID=3413936 RepID=UPI003C7C6C87
MKSFFGASLGFALAAAISASAVAADLPEVKISAANKVPACATPGRLTEYLRERNPRLNGRYEQLAALYKKHGEALGIRWDTAFFQMILETGALRYTGDVRPDQNNFAGLGASGGGAHGERFADISSGVKAHLQHLLMYAGDRIDDPVAERTRKVQEWGVLTDWQRSIDGPMTYTLVARQWAPTSRNYVRDVEAIQDGFYSSHCNTADPDPTASQEAQLDTPQSEPQKVATADEAPAASKGAEIAKRNIEAERTQGGALSGLGAGMLASVGASAKPAAEKAPEEDAPPVKLLNGNQSNDTAATDSKPAAPSKSAAKSDAKTSTKQAAKTKPASGDSASKGANVQTASIASAATQLKVPSAKSSKCKVFTASYGGQRAVIIKANGDGQTNYTVLDVTEANEKREIEAYIAAYAKGGERVGSFTNQTKALTKAFELCPEG